MEGRDLAKSRRAKNFQNKRDAATKRGNRKQKKGGISRRSKWSDDRAHLVRCYEDTQERSHRLGVTVPRSTLFDITKLAPLDQEEARKPDEACVIEVSRTDTLQFARRYVEELGLSPLVLNMASDFQPGGGVRKGSTAQEECIFRVSNAFLTHPEKWYPLDAHQVIYSPSVTVFKESVDRGKAHQLIQPWSTAMIAVAALRNPRTRGLEYRYEEDAELMEQKVEAIFKIARVKGHDSLVLGALGCGAFNNPPTAVAAIFKRAVDRHKHCFKRIGFAVLVTNSRDRSNFDAFQAAFWEGAPGNSFAY